MIDAPKPYTWVTYNDADGKPVARCIRVFDATLWELAHYSKQSDEDREAGTPHEPYWVGPVAVPDLRPVLNDQLQAEAALHKETHRRQGDQLSRIEHELRMLGDIVDTLNAERVTPSGPAKLRILDRLRAAVAAWKEGQH